MKHSDDISHSDRRFQSDMRHRARRIAQRGQRRSSIERQIQQLRGTIEHVAGDPDVTPAGRELLEWERTRLAELEARLAELEAQPEPPIPKKR